MWLSSIDGSPYVPQVPGYLKIHIIIIIIKNNKKALNNKNNKKAREDSGYGFLWKKKKQQQQTNPFRSIVETAEKPILLLIFCVSAIIADICR